MNASFFGQRVNLFGQWEVRGLDGTFDMDALPMTEAPGTDFQTSSRHRRRRSGRVRRLCAAPCADSAHDLVGRQDELDLIRRFVGESALAGAGLVLSGGRGSGKTVLLDVAESTSSAAGMRVLRAFGDEFDSKFSFSDLHQILSPLMSEVSQLAAVYQDALNFALGFDAGPPPDHLVISNAVVALLEHAALLQPLVLIVDDLQWLDRASSALLAFAARRGIPKVGFLGATRSGPNYPIEYSGIPAHVLRPLSDGAAIALLDSRFPTLASRVRQRLIAEAEGNPLALIELPAALSTPQLEAVEELPCTLPLTARLRGLFEGRITCLPEQTRRLLLLASLHCTGDLRVLRVAADTSRLFDDLAPAERDRLISLDDARQRVNFRHPLIRSSVVALSTGRERRTANRALASAMLHQPDQADRYVWHLAESLCEPDERVASMLDQVAYRMLHRGELTGAEAVSTRAAALSPAAADRARRLAFAAYQGTRRGECRTGSQLLAVARQTDPEFMGSLRDVLATAHLLMIGGDIFTAHKLLVGALRSHAASGGSDDKVVTEALQILAVASSLGSNDELWNHYREAVNQLSQLTSEVLPIYVVLNHTVLADPARATPSSLQQLEHAMVGLHNETDPTRIARIANSARYVDRLILCRKPLQRIVQESTGPGEVEASALRDLALDCFLTGQWDESAQHANDGINRVTEQQHWLRGWRYRYVLALLAAARGDDVANRAICDELISWAVPRGILTVHYASLRAGALAAIGRGDFEQAYRLAAAVSPPGQFASHNGEALFVCMDLVEAAVHTNRRDEASAHVAAMQDSHIAELSPRLALVASGSAALACPDNAAAEWFERALAVPDTERWPFDRARVQLAYGEHLRRTRSRSSARDHLSAALDVFIRLGAHPWAKRAGNELRATGQARFTEKRLAPALTPQEREIAKLAASGLSNKQIAERLYLSHRTVANHLHRVFPKLGISSRAGLRDALISDR